MSRIELHNIDCLPYMKQCSDKQFDLAIVDPPYGISGHKQRVFDDGKRWDYEIPSHEYFQELQRISVNQIIWGGNYFPDLWKDGCKGFVVWDKRQPEGLTFAMIEMAWTSFDIPAKLFFTKPAGERGFYTVDCKRIHPTQKPIELYKWLLHIYAKPGDKIIDTHLGSGSIALACEEYGFDLTATEIDQEYFAAASKRLSDYRVQMRLF